MITVVNKYKHTATENDVYIGRGSPLGSPYSHLDSKYNNVIKVDTREEAMELFRSYFDHVKRLDTSSDLAALKFNRALWELLNKAKTQDINLVCFCKPKACHGDVIKEWLDKQLENDNNRTI